MAITKIQSESVNLGDNFAFTGTVSGIAPNVPAWSARLTNNQAIGTGDHLLDFSTEIVDTNSAYNTSNKTFTVPSGQGGIYLIGLNGRFNTDNGSGAQDVLMKVFVNGSSALENGFYDLTAQIGIISVSGMVNVSAGDTINAYGNRNGGSLNTFYDNSLFWGIKIST
tara:strand:+ start:11 stop:511 length:501 start_codon:yes stop_codon:yes gene_type:complete